MPRQLKLAWQKPFSATFMAETGRNLENDIKVITDMHYIMHRKRLLDC